MNVAPPDATKKIALTNGVVLTVQQTFSSGIGPQFATARGWGAETQRDIVISTFAPGNDTQVDWKLRTSVTSTDGKNENKQYTGTMSGVDLKTSHALLFPVLWKQGEANAAGLSGIWISADAYEDLAKAHTATLDPSVTGMKAMTFGDAWPAPAASALNALAKDVETQLVHNDVYVTNADTTLGFMDVNLNGMRTTVEVLHAKNWFGQYDILANPQYPLILKFTPSEALVRRGVDSLFAYQVTDIAQLQE